MKTTFRDCVIKSILPGLCFLATIQICAGGSATWKPNPATGDWNQATNWTPRTVPNSSSDTATFASSSQRAVALSAGVEVNGINFNSAASAFTVTVPASLTLTISGIGLTNSSGLMQNFVAAIDGANNHGSVKFIGNATAGSLCTLTAEGQIVSGDLEAGIEFSDNSSAGSGLVINQGNLAAGFRGGRTRFLSNSTAADGIFINQACSIGGSSYGFGATIFLDSSNAGNAQFTNEGAPVSTAVGGATSFEGSSSAGNGTFTNAGGVGEASIGGSTSFYDTSTAGNATFNNKSGLATDASPGTIFFRGTSSAGSGFFTNDGALVANNTGSGITFTDTATAGNATITNKGGSVSGAAGGNLTFVSNATAENATVVSMGTAVTGAGGSHVTFFGTSSAGNATFVLNGGTVAGDSGAEMLLLEDSTGDSAGLKIHGNARLDISSHNPAFITLGSIAGDGLIYLGGMFLEVGFDNLSTTFSGVIQDGGQGLGVGGTLFKEGTGTLTLSSSNTYTGGTAIDDGALSVTNKSGSATGTGDLGVNQGTLGGTGKVAGSIILGTGAGSGAFLAPGVNGVGKVTAQANVTFGGLSTYLCEVDTIRKRSDSLSSRGVTISSNTTFALVPIGHRPIPSGTAFTVINNTSGSPIGGTFSNLADGSTVTDGTNSFGVNYEGGDGNDLSLTVQ